METRSIKRYKNNIHSQNGEDGIVSEIIKRIKPKVKRCVEFGGHDGYYCSNTRALIENGWEGRMYDINPMHESVERVEITPSNVNEIVGDCTVLSIDTDGPDWELWKAYKYTPSVVIIEINSSIIPDQEHFSYERGASFKTMNKLAESKGYFLLAHTGNCLYVRNEFKELFEDADETFDRSWLLI